MNEFHLPGHYASPFTHFLAAGLGEILVDSSIGGVAWGWTLERTPRAVMVADCDPSEVAVAVRRHALAHADGSSWVQAEFKDRVKGQALKGVLSPRQSAPKDWSALERERRQALDRIEGVSALDHRFLSALGRPAYWLDDTSQPNPDAGASRWEMKTRNRGEQFVGHRLAPLAQRVAELTVSSIADGLSGREMSSDGGRNAAESRTSTGLTPPGPVDDAQAWCALWGIAATATWWSPRGVGSSSGVVPARVTHPRRTVLPIFVRPVTPARYRHTLQSHDWAVVCAAVHDDAAEAVEVRVASAVSRLMARHVAAALVCEVHKGGSPSAPERYLLPGTARPLEQISVST